MTKFALFVDEGILGFNRSLKGHKCDPGDMVTFVPSVKIDKYWTMEERRTYVKHLKFNIYEFSFTAIKKYKNNLHPDCFHYLIEIGEQHTMFHFNWTKRGTNYLKVGELYEGYGRLSPCGNPSEENPYINPQDIQNITLQAELCEITENLMMTDYLNEFFASPSDSICDYDDALKKLGYWTDFNEFKKTILRYRHNGEIAQNTRCKNFVRPHIYRLNVLLNTL